MKITICNLGTIERAEIDLKPLTIFIGPNNTGKTWTAMALAGIFGPYGFTPYLDAYIQGEVSNDYRQLDEAVGHITKTGTAAIDMVQFANDYGDIYFNNVAHFCKRWLASFMGTDLVSFDDLDVSMDLLETKENLLNQMLNASLRGDIIGAQEKSTFTIRKAQCARLTRRFR